MIIRSESCKHTEALDYQYALTLANAIEAHKFPFDLELRQRKNEVNGTDQYQTIIQLIRRGNVDYVREIKRKIRMMSKQILGDRCQFMEMHGKMSILVSP